MQWYMDGIDNTSRNGSRQIRLVITTPENVEEMQLMTGAYSAEFGRAAGGVVNVITRSGTNQLRGSAMAMIRPSDLIARPPLAATRPKQTWHMLQGNAGGPLLRDRLFLFGNYEFNPYTSASPITITPAAIAAQDLGNPAVSLRFNFVNLFAQDEWRVSPNLTLKADSSLRSAIATMRRSGLFARDAALDDETFVARSWERAAEGLNSILAVYGKGQQPRYPAIDAVSHDAASAPYGQVVHTAVSLMNEEAAKWGRFYRPTLALALRLLDINWRDEAGRHEPMHLGANAAAYKRGWRPSGGRTTPTPWRWSRARVCPRRWSARTTR
jgi:hypothetical protein